MGPRELREVYAEPFAAVIRNAGLDTEEHWPSKVTAARLEAGDTLQITVPNSAGYGDPLERDPQLVRSDVLDGFTTLTRAERDYGVVIDPETMLIDAGETARRRQELSSRPVPA
jgi:N-methylhydantoinase B/oxoprolinase/acetone carboxylase alpha subunit